MNEPELTKCPHCGARGVKIADRRIRDGFAIVADYCGKCGKNWPRGSNVMPDHIPDDFAPEASR